MSYKALHSLYFLVTAVKKGLPVSPRPLSIPLIREYERDGPAKRVAAASKRDGAAGWARFRVAGRLLSESVTTVKSTRYVPCDSTESLVGPVIGVEA
jgi:hypothetical protein